MERIATFNVIKRHVGFIGVDAFMCFIDDEDIPFCFGNFVKLTIFSAKIRRTFKVL